MQEKKLGKFFESYLEKESLFLDKSALQSSYVPDEIQHRDEQIEQIASILAPVLKQEVPSNLFIYGKTGTGKTLTIKYVSDQLKKVAKEKNIPLEILYLNCKLKKIADTEYRLIAELARHFGKAIPSTGLPTDEVYNLFFKALDEKKKTVLIILDEIDQLVKKTGDELIYNLTRINSELKNSKVTIIGISNVLTFVNTLDPRVKSSLSEEEIVFPPYNAIQIQNILRKRAEKAFKKEIMDSGVIEKCAAFAARDHGDARRALDLLRVAGELAERKDQKTIKIENLDEAEDKIEKDRVLELVKNQPKQFQVTLYAIMLKKPTSKDKIFTGEIYETYKTICQNIGLRPLTQRRVSDIIAEFDMLGIINCRVLSKGRYGRTREITLSLSESMEPKIIKILEEDLEVKKKNELF
ncbi:MAG: ORC1-type DNA replication protein [Nanoarchaeota archaeon]|nr:ORC1-type DNA replication protein [Nanoarchaeota archaeon]MBU1270522.1 ORC1-type DNA replication protein [Nanoarchaeota archaeon]MBU1605135.1 ORC1-type DNA replication protein [Nanoarchaeota archaeon]MBU2442692.1 ORC1-type DNA replication protein [Nanoarchaeota archaeon]